VLSCPAGCSGAFSNINRNARRISNSLRVLKEKIMPKILVVLMLDESETEAKLSVKGSDGSEQTITAEQGANPIELTSAAPVTVTLE
jgi:hypothetical protein